MNKTTTPTPAPTPFGPLPTELEHLHSSFGYAFDPHLFLHLRLALASGSSHLLLRLSSTHLDKHGRVEAVEALAAQLDWLCRTLYGLETNQVPCTRQRVSANAFLKSWLVPDPNHHNAFAPLSSPSGPISPRAATTTTTATARFTPRLNAAASSSRGASPSPDPNSAALAQPTRSISRPRAPPLVGLDIDLAHNPPSSIINRLGHAGKPSIMANSPHESRPSRAKTHEPDPQAGLDLTPRPTQSQSPPDHSVPSSPAIASAVHWDARVAPPQTMSSSSFGQPFKLETSNLSSPPLTRRRRSTITVRPLGSPPLSSKRLPQVVILERLDRTSLRTQQAMLKTLRDRRMTLDGPLSTSSGLKREGNGAGTPIPTPTTTSTMTTTGTTNGFLRSRRTSGGVHGSEGGSHGGGGAIDWILPDGFLCIAIVLEEGDRGDWGGLDRYLLDQFALSLTIPSRTYDFRRPPTTLSHPLSTPPISPHAFPSSILPWTFSDALVNYQNDLISTLRLHPRLEGRFLTSRASKDLTSILQTWVVLRHGHHSNPNQRDEIDQTHFDPSTLVLPNDVVHVLLPVLGHRLRIKDAKDEKSVFWGSEIAALERRKGGKERRVERVIRGVVEEV